MQINQVSCILSGNLSGSLTPVVLAGGSGTSHMVPHAQAPRGILTTKAANQTFGASGGPDPRG